MNKFILLLAISALTVFPSCTGAPSADGGRVKVEGNKFIGPDGKELVFRGLCFSDPVKLVREGQWNERYFAEAAGWGANVVRFAVHPSNLNSMGWDETFEAMDKGVAWAKQYGMYVIMDWHSIGNLKDERYTSPMYYTTREETFKFWRTVAERYKDEPTVALYELFNEPTVTAPDVGTCTWTEWKELQEEIIDTVRTYNPAAVCLCAGFNWAYDLTPVATEPIDRPNIAYVSHPYPMKRSEPWEERWEKDFGFVADTYPVICTEIGYCLADEPGAHIPVMSTDVYGEHITRYFEQKGISFTVWCFDTSWAPMLISDWDFTPTTQGRFFKAYLQGKETLQTGDLLFVGPDADGQGAMDEAIAAATGDLTHVAIVEVDATGNQWVIDATPRRGVCRYPLDTLVSDHPGATFLVRRLRDTSGVSASVGNARRFIGEPYDLTFLPDNNAFYCSELVHEAYRRADGSPVFEAKPMNFLAPDGSMPAYWASLFERLGMPVPQGVPGTNPQDMSLSPALQAVPGIKFNVF